MEAEEKYQWESIVEAWVVTVVCSSADAWNRAGHSLNLGALARPESGLAIRAISQIVRETGIASAGQEQILAMVRRWVLSGRESREDYYAVVELFWEAEDARVPLGEGMATSVAALVRSHIATRLKSWMDRGA